MKLRKSKIILASILLINFLALTVANSQNIPNSSGNIALASIPNGAPIFEVEATGVQEITPNEECLVPCNQIYAGQVKDGIPSIDNPKFIEASNGGAPNNREKVIGVVLDGEARAYPYDILNWHEIVNDVFNGVHVSVTYCPLTGSGILYHTSAQNNTELGTSGNLYENNLVFYDRNTDTEWSQMGNVALRGEQLATNITYSEAIETTWEAWKKLYPDTVVLSRDTGSSRDYTRFPYGNYRSDSSIYFPTSYNPNVEPYNLYHEKALAQIVSIQDEVLLLPFEELAKAPTLNHIFNGANLLTIYHQNDDLAITYSSEVNGSILTFSPFTDNLDILSSNLTLDLPLFIDNQNNIWNFKGEAIFGDLNGTKLLTIPTYNAYWFAASTFHYDAAIFVINGDTVDYTTHTFTETIESEGTTIIITTEVVSNILTSYPDGTPEEQNQDLAFASYSPFYLVAFGIMILPRIIKKRNK